MQSVLFIRYKIMTQWRFANVISISTGQRLCQTLKNSVNILLDHMAFCEWGDVYECGEHNLFPIEFTLHENARSSWRLVFCALILTRIDAVPDGCKDYAHPWSRISLSCCWAAWHFLKNEALDVFECLVHSKKTSLFLSFSGLGWCFDDVW